MMYRWITQMTQSLENLDKLVDKAKGYAESNDLDPDTILRSTLAPDMFDFMRQVQTACDTAKFTASRLSASIPPAYPDDEETFDDLHERIQKTARYLEESFDEERFEGWAERRIELPFAKGQFAYGADYLHQFAIPNFYFHVTTAYDILRAQGVPVGKRDYLGFVSMHPMD